MGQLVFTFLKGGIKAIVPIRNLGAAEKICYYSAVCMVTLITLVKVKSRSDHVVRRCIAKKILENDVDACLRSL